MLLFRSVFLNDEAERAMRTVNLAEEVVPALGHERFLTAVAELLGGGLRRHLL
jgi:hypothetical protein